MVTPEQPKKPRVGITFAKGGLSNRERPDLEGIELELLVHGGAMFNVVPAAPEGATPLLGALTLESLGLTLDPVTRQLLPMRLFLARAS